MLLTNRLSLKDQCSIRSGDMNSIATSRVRYWCMSQLEDRSNSCTESNRKTETVMCTISKD